MPRLRPQCQIRAGGAAYDWTPALSIEFSLRSVSVANCLIIYLVYTLPRGPSGVRSKPTLNLLMFLIHSISLSHSVKPRFYQAIAQNCAQLVNFGTLQN